MLWSKGMSNCSGVGPPNGRMFHYLNNYMIMENVGCMAFSIKIALITVFFIASGSILLADDTDTVDFAHDIVPILREHCFECHGGDEAEGGFSINNRRLFLEGEAAIPGDAVESLFLQLIEDPDPEYRMPSKDKPPVPEEEIELLKRWVNEGMEWETGFAFGNPYQAPLRPRLQAFPPPRTDAATP